MKAIAVAIVLCTLIICASIYALPFINEQTRMQLERGQLELARQKQAAAERDVTILFLAPAATPEARGMQEYKKGYE